MNKKQLETALELMNKYGEGLATKVDAENALVRIRRVNNKGRVYIRRFYVISDGSYYDGTTP